MGNKSIIERIQNAREVNFVSRFNLEDLINDSSLESFYDNFLKKSEIEIDNRKAYKEDFNESNEQKDEFLQDLIKDKTIREINEAITTGFSTPSFFIEDLKEPSKDT